MTNVYSKYGVTDAISKYSFFSEYNIDLIFNLFI